MVERLCKKRNPCTLLVGMQIGAVTLENNMEVPQKAKHRVTVWSISVLGIYSEKTKTLIQKDICSPMFIAALFTIANTWKQAKCPPGEWIKKWWNIISHKKIMKQCWHLS